MKKYTIALFLIVCVIATTLLTVDSISADDATCGKGWEMRGGECKPCDDICKERISEYYVYDPDKSSANKCECECEIGYEIAYERNPLAGNRLSATCKKITGGPEVDNCDDHCKTTSGENAEHAIGEGDYPNCDCECEKGWTMEEQGCVSCEDFCEKKEGGHYIYDPDKSYTNICECKCEDGYKSDWDDSGNKICKKVECPTNSTNVTDLPGSNLPSNNRKLNRDCYCDEGYTQSYGECVVEADEEEVDESLIDWEREHIKADYNQLNEGYVLFVEGLVNTQPLRTVLGEADYGHSAVYIGDYQVPKGGEFFVRDEDQAPLKVFRKGKPIELEQGDITEEGDWIIGAVVEARGTGIVVTTVDKMKDVARQYFGREPNFVWKTTNPPPTAEQKQIVRDFALRKVALTEKKKIAYFPGKQGEMGYTHLNLEVPKERWDCVSFVEGAFEAAGIDLTPDPLDEGISIQPQEQHDYMGSHQKRSNKANRGQINITVHSPINLHLYDSQGRHVGITPTGTFEREIPYAYYDLELEDILQSINIQDVDDEYTLVTEVVDNGSFTLKIHDLNVHTPGNLTVFEFEDVTITKGAVGTLNIGYTDQDIQIEIDDDGDGKTDRTIEPSSIDSKPSSTDGTSPTTLREAAGLVGESRTVIPGGTVSVPVRMENVEDIGSLNFNITYDSNVVNIDRVDRGSLLSGTSFVNNPNEPGIIRFGFATVDGVSGSGPIGYIVCNAIGNDGSYTPLTISGVEATDSSGNPVTLQTVNGSVTIDSDGVNGDSNGDGVLTELDALAALRMSVNLMEEDLILDIDQDRTVTAKDALAILSIAVRGR